MEYSAIAREMMQLLQSDLENYLQGRKENYCYQEEFSEEYGKDDKNYTNRTRLCYALFYAEQEIPEKETIIRELFQEEVISRENDDFQGIGVNLELLSVMLREYEPLDSALFQRAKDANYDCFCGYDPAIYRYESLADLDLTDYVQMAGDMHLPEYACRFVDVFKKQELTLEQLQELRLFAKYDTHRDCDRELAVTKIYEAMQNAPDIDRHSFAFCRSVEEYIELLIQKQDTAQALTIFLEHADNFREDFGSYSILGAELMLQDSACRESVWTKIHPLILEMLKEEEIPFNSYHSFAECADRMRKPGLAGAIREAYANLLREQENDNESESSE
ncbi:MAG: hypothetical protein K2H29_00910 [Oscillospiraceae bacterium]|nr:hypothetical protein [Oscillospiraceae bacterium]